MCNLVMVIGPHLVCIEWLLPPLPWVGGSLLLLSLLFPNHPIYMVGHTALGAWQRVTQSLCFPYMMERGLLFQVWCHQMTWSTLNLWWALNLVILVWWLGIRLMSLLAPGLQSGLLPCYHIYPGLTGKVSSLTHFPLEPGCEDYAFLDQAVGDFEQGLDSILTDSLDTRIGHFLGWAWCHYIFSLLLGFSTQLVPFLIILSHSLLLAFLLHKLWCQARALLAPVSLATKMSASKLIHYFSSHPAAFGFWASTPPDNITLNSANRKADQSLSDFQTGFGATALCYSWHRATHLSPQGCPCWYSFLSTWCWGRCYTCVWSAWITSQGSWHFGQGCFQMSWKLMAFILAYLFNSVSRQHCEVWASQFPFLHSLRDVIPPSEACLYGHINWSLAQVHHQSSVGLSQSFPPREGWQGQTMDWVPFHSTEETYVRVCARA